MRVGHMGWESASASGNRKVRSGSRLVSSCCIALHCTGVDLAVWDMVGSSLFFYPESAGACTSAHIAKHIVSSASE